MFNVEDFQSGGLNDRQLIQGALDHAVNTGQSLYFPSRVYLLDAGISIALKGAPLALRGECGSILKFSGQGAKPRHIFLFQGGRQICLSQLHFDGSQEVPQLLRVETDEETEDARISIKGCSFRQASQNSEAVFCAGLYIRGLFNHISIDHCTFSNIRSNTSAKGSRGAWISTEGRETYGSEPAEVQISHCQFEEIRGQHREDQPFENDADGIHLHTPTIKKNLPRNFFGRISHCRFHNCATRSIKIQIARSSVHYNTFSRHQLEGAIEVDAQYGGSHICSNVFTLVDSDMGIIDETTGSVRSSSVIGSSLSKYGASDLLVSTNRIELIKSKINAVVAIAGESDEQYLRSLQQITITENHVRGESNSFLYIRDPSHQRCANNVCTLANNTQEVCRQAFVSARSSLGHPALVKAMVHGNQVLKTPVPLRVSDKATSFWFPPGTRGNYNLAYTWADRFADLIAYLKHWVWCRKST